MAAVRHVDKYNNSSGYRVYKRIRQQNRVGGVALHLDISRSVAICNIPSLGIMSDILSLLSLHDPRTQQFSKFLPFMAVFHTQMSFIYTIYKRFKGSGISEVLVATGVISDASVDQVLHGKHFKRGVRCLWLCYETLIHHALNKRLEGSPLSEEVNVSLLS